MVVSEERWASAFFAVDNHNPIITTTKTSIFPNDAQSVSIALSPSLVIQRTMTEDEIYRVSTQYRLWNFTPEQLEERRTNTNALAVQQTRAAFKRKRDLAAQLSSADASATTSEAEGNGNGTNGASKADVEEVECLTPDEEKRLVAYICFNLLEMVMEQKRFGELPIHVAVRPITLGAKGRTN